MRQFCKYTHIFLQYVWLSCCCCISWLFTLGIWKIIIWWCYNLGRDNRGPQDIVVDIVSPTSSLYLPLFLGSTHCCITSSNLHLLVPISQPDILIPLALVGPYVPTISILLSLRLLYPIPFEMDIILASCKPSLELFYAFFQCNYQFYIYLQLPTHHWVGVYPSYLYFVSGIHIWYPSGNPMWGPYRAFNVGKVGNYV